VVAQFSTPLEALHERILNEVFGKCPVADAPVHEAEELAVHRDQFVHHVLRQAARAARILPVAVHRAPAALGTRKRRNSRLLSSTDTLDKDIAALAYTGDRPMPSPAKAPAATGMPSRL